MNQNQGSGTLRIWATTAGGSLPVSGVPVRIFSEDGDLLHVLRTGESGLTPVVTLPAPPASDSLQPGSPTRTYAPYIVTAELAGYQPIREMTVPIFDGIASIQPLSLVPAGMQPRTDGPVLVYPEMPYARLQNGSVVREDPLGGEEPPRPLEDEEGYLDDTDLMDAPGLPDRRGNT